jgi:probable rRNA maturation factor
MNTMATVDLQVASDSRELPDEEQIRSWVLSALEAAEDCAGNEFELSVRLVDEDESRDLNNRYRNQDKATNVLSFPFERIDGLPDEVLRPLGDLVICAPVVAQEASEQSKAILDHWAHMVVHGTLHLLGYDHQDEAQAETMEALEMNILRDFGIENPYREN